MWNIPKCNMADQIDEKLWPMRIYSSAKNIEIKFACEYIVETFISLLQFVVSLVTT